MLATNFSVPGAPRVMLGFRLMTFLIHVRNMSAFARCVSLPPAIPKPAKPLIQKEHCAKKYPENTQI